MVGVSNLVKYRDELDKNGKRVGDWAVEVDKGQTKCKFQGGPKFHMREPTARESI